MALSAFDLYSIGIGPSSSHTVGPMRAAKRFVDALDDCGVLGSVTSVQIELFGSLGATGHGHGSPAAVVLGLQGEDPATVDVDGYHRRVRAIRESGRLRLGGTHEVGFDIDRHLVMHRRRTLPGHPNAMVFRAQVSDDALPFERTYYSVGGGFVLDDAADGGAQIVADQTPLPNAFTTAAELLDHCHRHGLAVSDIMLVNERAWRNDDQIRQGMLQLWQVMQACVRRGCHTDGVLPGGMRVERRAPALYRELVADAREDDTLRVLDWVGMYAIAVNEENASGGRVVTAPTNGAAGIIPAVLHYYARFIPGADDNGVVRFLLTAAAIGILFKENASISGAEVGCQGEVGSACAMAAGALCEALGGTPAQVENAAEIGIEHNLGLTCDPIGGLVQIPCIERNAMASVKAINAARLALQGDGSHRVSLDKAITTMRDTGADMSTKYKETARGGLAVNVIEC